MKNWSRTAPRTGGSRRAAPVISARRLPFWTLIALLTALGLAGCAPLTDQLSWSGDGRYLAFIHPQTRNLWLWDAATESPRLLLEQKLVGARFLPSGSEIVCVVEQPSNWVGLKGELRNEETLEVDLLNADNRAIQKVDFDAKRDNFPFSISGDGRSLFYTKREPAPAGKPSEIELWFYDLGRRTAPPRRVFKQPAEFTHLGANDDGSKILFSSQGVISVIDRDGGNAKKLLAAPKGEEFQWPQWTAKNEEILYVASFAEKEASPPRLSELRLRSLVDGSEQVLSTRVFAFSPPSISADGKKLLTGIVPAGVSLEEGDFKPSELRLALIDLQSRETQTRARESSGIASPLFDPKGERAAYLTESGVRILDLQSRRKTIPWSDEAEKLFALAEGLFEKGEVRVALEKHHEFLDRFPKNWLKDFALYRLFEIQLKPPFSDLDQAFNALRGIGDGSMKSQAFEMFWQDRQPLASDPPKDWIVTYGTEESRRAAKFDTDLTRDLRAVWARWGAGRLYLRLDYGSSKDLKGLEFQDTLVLFEYGPSTTSLRTISPSVSWDRGAACQIRLRHFGQDWDVQVTDGEGKNVAGLVGRRMGLMVTDASQLLIESNEASEETGSIMIALSPGALPGYFTPHDIGLQVCTFKGSADGKDRAERPRVNFVDGKPVCDVADAFGKENTKERLESDAKAGTPLVIRGLAGVLPASERRNTRFIPSTEK